MQALSDTTIPTIRGSTTVVGRPISYDSPCFTVEALILPHVTGVIQCERTMVSTWPQKGLLQEFQLTYPNFNQHP